MPKKITLELSERQARILKHAVEVWFRLCMGQQSDLADDLAFLNYKKEDKDFDERITRRNAIRHVIRAAHNIAFPLYGTPGIIPDDVHVASDIWSALRYELGPKDLYCTTPFQMSTEPLPIIYTLDYDPDENLCELEEENLE